MDPAEYAKLDRLEERMWWFAAMHANLLMLARDFDSSAAPDRVLDAGCGTGGLLAKLAADRPQAMMVGLDADQTACTRAEAKSARPLCRAATAFERMLLKAGLRFPFGGSLIAIAGKSTAIENADV